jgi:hypothetical protein
MSSNKANKYLLEYKSSLYINEPRMSVSSIGKACRWHRGHQHSNHGIGIGLTRDLFSFISAIVVVGQIAMTSLYWYRVRALAHTLINVRTSDEEGSKEQQQPGDGAHRRLGRPKKTNVRISDPEWL